MRHLGVGVEPPGALERGDVLVRGDTIEAVGPDLAEQAEQIEGLEVIDAQDMIVIPGFVDSHVHAWEGQLRGIAPTADFGAYLGITAFGVYLGPRYTPDDNYAGTLATALVALDAGITTLVDNSHNARSLEHSVAAVQALSDAGIRAVHAVGAPFGSADDEVPGIALELRDRFRGELTSIRLFDVNPGVGLWEFARDAGFWVSSETGPHTPSLPDTFETLHEKGLLTPQHALNHCYDLPDRIWDLIAGSGAVVNLCPRSDAAFGLGSTVPPVEQALSRGITVGLADAVGSITPGEQADLVLIRTDDVATYPTTDPAGTVTAFANSGNVDTVLVGGRFRKRHGELVGVDLDVARALAQASRRRLLA